MKTNELMAKNLMDIVELNGWTAYSVDEILLRLMADMGLTLANSQAVNKNGIGRVMLGVATLLKKFEIEDANYILMIDDNKYIATDNVVIENHRLIEEVNQLVRAVNAGYSNDVEDEAIKVIRQLKAVCALKNFIFWDCVNIAIKGM